MLNNSEKIRISKWNCFETFHNKQVNWTVQIISPIESVWHVMKKRISRPQTAEQVKSLPSEICLYLQNTKQSRSLKTQESFSLNICQLNKES